MLTLEVVEVLLRLCKIYLDASDLPVQEVKTALGLRRQAFHVLGVKMGRN